MTATTSDTQRSFKGLVESSEYDGLFFPGAGRKKAVDSLLHFARYGSMLLFLRGCEGSGRSAVLGEFAKAVDRDTQVIKIDTQTDNLLPFIADEVDRLAVEINKLVEQVAALDVEGAASSHVDPQDLSGNSGAESSESASARISRHLKRLAARGRRLVAVFDDAITFTDEELASLIRLAEKNDGIFKLIFSGEEVLASRISDLSERQTVLVNFIDLPVFSTKEGLAYIKYWLEAANFENATPYKEQQVETALKRSEGNLNQFHRILSDTPMSEARESRSPMLPFPHLVAAFGLLLAIVLLWLFSGEAHDNREDVDPIVLTKVEDIPPQSSGVVDDAKNSEANDAVLADQINVNDQASKKTAKEVLAEANGYASKEETAKAGVAIVLSDEEAAQQGSQRDGEQAGSAIISDEAAERAAEAAKEAREKVATKEVAGQNLETGSGSTESGTTAKALTTASQGANLSKAPSARAQAVHDRLLGWPETGYALQVFGTHNTARAEQMVKDYFGRADLVFYETRHNDKPWFVVITGPFTGSEAARNGISELPDGLRGLRPWPRNIASIHRDIRRYHGR